MFSQRIFDLIFFCWDDHHQYHEKNKTAKYDKISFSPSNSVYIYSLKYEGEYIKYITEVRKHKEEGRG